MVASRHPGTPCGSVLGRVLVLRYSIIGLLVQDRNQVFDFFSSRLRCFPFIAWTGFQSMKPSKIALGSVGPLLSFCFPGPAECAERLNKIMDDWRTHNQEAST